MISKLMHKHTRAKLRAKYKETWGQEWPHDNRYLQQLWEEAGKLCDYARDPARHDIVQNAMRECDDTILSSWRIQS